MRIQAEFLKAPGFSVPDAAALLGYKYALSLMPKEERIKILDFKFQIQYCFK
jgi:hypothetical protein